MNQGYPPGGHGGPPQGGPPGGWPPQQPPQGQPAQGHGYAPAPQGHGYPAPPGQPQAYPGQYPGQPGQPHPGQPPGQTTPGQQPGPPYPGAAPPGQTYPGQAPGQTYPGQAPGQTYPGQAPGQTHPGGYPAQAGQQPAKKSNTGLIVGGIVGGLFVLGLIGGAAFMFLGGAGGVLPVDVGNLPSKTKTFSRSGIDEAVAESIGIGVGDLPSEALWSYHARSACGGQDVFDALMDAPLGKVKSAARVAAAKPDDLRTELACGKDVASSAKATYFVSFEHDDKRQFVTLFPLGIDALPDDLKRLKNTSDPSSMSGARCVIPSEKPDDSECSDSAVVMAKLEGTKIWVRGLKDDLKAFGADYSADGSNKSSKADEMYALAKELSSYAVTRVATGDSFSASDISLRGDGVSMYDEEESKKLKKVVEDEASMIGVGGKLALDGAEMKLVFVGKSESGAKSIESSLKDFHSRLKEKIEEARKKDSEKEDKKSDLPKRFRQFLEAKSEVSRRALEKASINREGPRVEFLVVEQPSDGEKKIIDKFVAWRKKQATIASKIVNGLLEGKAPGDDDLKELGGDELMTAIEQQKKYAKWGGLEPEPWFAVDGFKVPGGGKYDSATLDGVTFHVFKYDMDKAKLQEIFEEIAKDAGWTIEKDDTIYKATKGSKSVSVTYGSPKDGGSTLVLVH